MIEYITEQYLDEALEFGNELEMTQYERLVRVMAAETRFHRRILSRAILERADRAREQAVASLLASGQPDVNYVLYIGRGDQGGDHGPYRQARAAQLKARCIAAKAARPGGRFVVGMAMDARGVCRSSEDSSSLIRRAGTLQLSQHDWPETVAVRLAASYEDASEVLRHYDKRR